DRRTHRIGATGVRGPRKHRPTPAPLAPPGRIGYRAPMSTTTTRRGGTIPELVAGLATLALLAALVIPGAARMRAESRTASSLSQLRWIAGTTNAYAADSADQF